MSKTILTLFKPNIYSMFYKVKKDFEKARAKNPVICPCCGQRSQIWKKRPISSAVAALIKLVNLYDGEPIHLDRFNVAQSDRGNGNFSQLALWGLIERADNSDKKKRSSGMYEPTREGVDFVYCLISIPKHVYTLNDEVINTEGPQVYIKDVLGDKFDYQELMDMQY